MSLTPLDLIKRQANYARTQEKISSSPSTPSSSSGSSGSSYGHTSSPTPMRTTTDPSTGATTTIYYPPQPGRQGIEPIPRVNTVQDNFAKAMNMPYTPTSTPEPKETVIPPFQTAAYAIYNYKPDDPDYQTIYSDITSKKQEIVSGRRQTASDILSVVRSDTGTTFNIGDKENLSKKEALNILIGNQIGLWKSSKELSQYEGKVKKYEAGGFLVDIKDTGVIFKEPPAKDTYNFYMRRDTTDVFVAKQAMTLGIPASMNAVGPGIIFGIPGLIVSTVLKQGRWNEYEEEEYAGLLNLSKKPKEEFLGYTGRFWSSPEAIESTWLPLITMGAGYTVTTLSKIGTTGAKLVVTGIKTGLVTSTIVGVGTGGVAVASTAMNNPEQLGTVSGHLLSGGILAAGGYTTGEALASGGFRSPTADIGSSKNIDETIKADVELTAKLRQIPKSETILETGKILQEQGNIADIQVSARARLVGEQTGRISTGEKTINFKMDLTGEGGKPISDYIQVSKSEGIIKDSFGRITADVEAYGKNTVPQSIGKNTYLNAEEFLSLSTSEKGSPMIYRGRGLRFSTESGERLIDIEYAMTGRKSSSVDIAKVDVTSSSSIGTFESQKISLPSGKITPNIKGVYKEVTVAEVLKSFGETNIRLEAERGISEFKSDVTASSSLLRSMGQSTEVLSFKNEVISGAVSNAMTGFAAIPLSGSELSMSVIATGLSGIAKTMENKSLSTTLLEPKIDVLSIPRLGSISIPKMETVSIPKSEIISIQKTDILSIPKTEVISIPKSEVISFSKTELITIPKTETIQIAKPVTIPVVTPTVFPFDMGKIYGMGGDWGWENWWGTKKRYRKAKTIDPFAEMRTSMKKSQKSIDFGLKKNIGGKNKLW